VDPQNDYRASLHQVLQMFLPKKSKQNSKLNVTAFGGFVVELHQKSLVFGHPDDHFAQHVHFLLLRNGLLPRVVHDDTKDKRC
jgi:hypothetical protein